MTRDELLSALAGLRKANIGGRRAPHKPLLLLWLLGRLAAHGSSHARLMIKTALVTERWLPQRRASH